ncbi:hypothetical protein BGW42_004877 [Actinomortierella wolfii]|nr:hypothetical protein BGW42_004877 [Actinomortierella wolfii]
MSLGRPPPPLPLGCFSPPPPQPPPPPPPPSSVTVRPEHEEIAARQVESDPEETESDYTTETEDEKTRDETETESSESDDDNDDDDDHENVNTVDNVFSVNRRRVVDIFEKEDSHFDGEGLTGDGKGAVGNSNHAASNVEHGSSKPSKRRAELREQQLDDLNSLDKWKELLQDDPMLNERAQRIEFFHDSKMRDMLSFVIRDYDFLTWLKHHQNLAVEGAKNTNLVNVFANDAQIHSRRKQGGVTGKPRSAGDSSKTGCSARLYAIAAPPRPGNHWQWMLVRYRFFHNHDTGLARALTTCRLSNAKRQRFREMLKMGYSIRQILDIAEDELSRKRQLMRIKNRPFALCRDEVIEYQDVYNVWKDLAKKDMQKHGDPVLSSISWMVEFKSQGWWVYYDRSDQNSGRYFGFASSWQLEELRLNVVMNRDTSKSIPVAFLLTTTQEAGAVGGWLKGIRDEMSRRFSTEGNQYTLKPVALVTDQGHKEIAAVKLAFGQDVNLHLCNRHLYNTWASEVPKCMTFKPEHTIDIRSQLKYKIVEDLKTLQSERDKNHAFALIEKFWDDWKEHPNALSYLSKQYCCHPAENPARGSIFPTLAVAPTPTMSAASVLAAVNRNASIAWYGDRCSQGVSVSDIASAESATVNTASHVKTGSIREHSDHISLTVDPNSTAIDRKHWMACFMQETALMGLDNANSVILSWHNVLKENLFKEKQKRRLDWILYILANNVVVRCQSIDGDDQITPNKSHTSSSSPSSSSSSRRLERRQRRLARKHMAKRLNMPYWEDPVEVVLDDRSDKMIGERSVESYRGPHLPRYLVRITYVLSGQGYMTSCTCLDFIQNNKHYCKHMALVNIQEPSLLISFTNVSDVQSSESQRLPVAKEQTAEQQQQQQTTTSQQDTGQDINLAIHKDLTLLKMHMLANAAKDLDPENLDSMADKILAMVSDAKQQVMERKREIQPSSDLESQKRQKN